MIHICNCIGWKNFCQELDSISVLCLSVCAFVDTYAFVLWKLLWAIQWNSAVHMWCTASISCQDMQPQILQVSTLYALKELIVLVKLAFNIQRSRRQWDNGVEHVAGKEVYSVQTIFPSVLTALHLLSQLCSFTQCRTFLFSVTPSSL